MSMHITLNGKELSDDRPGMFMILGWTRDPSGFNTIVEYASNKLNAIQHLKNKHPNKVYDAIFAIRQSDEY